MGLILNDVPLTPWALKTSQSHGTGAFKDARGLSALLMAVSPVPDPELGLDVHLLKEGMKERICEIYIRDHTYMERL